MAALGFGRDIGTVLVRHFPNFKMTLIMAVQVLTMLYV